MATNSGAGPDLRTYVRENGPLPPHRAALLVASLAEHLAVVNAEGSAYREIDAETVHIASSSQRLDVLLSGQLIPLNDAGASDNVGAAGSLLAWLLGAAPRGARPDGTPPVLWQVVESCTSADAAKRPSAALLARLLRDAARDLLLGVTAAAPAAGRASIPAPRYLPNNVTAQPPRGPRSRWTGKAVLAGATCVLAIGIAGAGLLLPAAGIHLPFTKGGLVQVASRGIAAISPTRAAPATRAVTAASTGSAGGQTAGSGSAADAQATPTGSAIGSGSSASDPQATPATVAPGTPTSTPIGAGKRSSCIMLEDADNQSVLLGPHTTRVLWTAGQGTCLSFKHLPTFRGHPVLQIGAGGECLNDANNSIFNDSCPVNGQPSEDWVVLPSSFGPPFAVLQNEATLLNLIADQPPAHPAELSTEGGPASQFNVWKMA